MSDKNLRMFRVFSFNYLKAAGGVLWRSLSPFPADRPAAAAAAAAAACCCCCCILRCLCWLRAVKAAAAKYADGAAWSGGGGGAAPPRRLSPEGSGGDGIREWAGSELGRVGEQLTTGWLTGESSVLSAIK